MNGVYSDRRGDLFGNGVFNWRVYAVYGRLGYFGVYDTNSFLVVCGQRDGLAKEHSNQFEHCSSHQHKQ